MWRTAVLSVLLLLTPSTVWAIQPAEAQLAAYRDVLTLPPEERSYTVYLWVKSDDPKEKWADWAACSAWLNFLSTKRRIVSPVTILSDGTARQWPNLAEADYAKITLIRVNRLHYGYSPEQWNRLGDPSIEPYFHVRTLIPEWQAGYYQTGNEKKWYDAGPSKLQVGYAPWILEPLGLPRDQPARDIYLHTYFQAAQGLTHETGSTAPIIEARNFIWQTAIDFDRKAGYYSWLGVKDKKSFDRLVRLDETIMPLREAVSDSGVAVQPRRLERYGRGDGYWITYDQVNQRAQGRHNPLTQIDDKFLFDASEVFGRLDNGLWALGLFDSKGVVQQSAPDGVGYFHKTITNDGKIHVGLSCLVCHDSQPGRGGLHPFVPYFRTLYAEPGNVALAAKRFKFLEKFDELYLTPFDPPWATVDRTIYAGALYQACGLTPDKFAGVLYEVFHRYDRSLDIEMAAWEHGTTAAEFQRALQQSLVTYGTINNVDANWCNPPQRRMRIGRDQFVEVFNLTELALRGLNQNGWPDRLRVKYDTKPSKN